MALKYLLYTKQDVKTCCLTAAIIRNKIIYDKVYGIECA